MYHLERRVRSSQVLWGVSDRVLKRNTGTQTVISGEYNKRAIYKGVNSVKGIPQRMVQFLWARNRGGGF